MAVRKFTWADLPALLTFTESIQAGDGHAGRDLRQKLFQQVLGQPGMDPEANCLLLEEGGSLLGYCLVFPEPSIRRAVLGPDLAPEATGGPLERELVRHAVERAREVHAQEIHLCLAGGSPRQKLLEEEGFSRVRVYWDMLWDLDSLPAPCPREGFTLRCYGPGDAAALTDVQNAAFTGSWGFAPNTVDQIAYRAEMANTSHEGIRFLHHGADLVGYCWTCVVPDGSQTKGVIGMIGIPPEYRGQGISKPLLLDGMAHLRSVGVSSIGLHVDGSNTPAIRLYTSVGFEKVGELHWYECKG